MKRPMSTSRSQSSCNSNILKREKYFSYSPDLKMSEVVSVQRC